jgi:hypothetical protein
LDGWNQSDVKVVMRPRHEPSTRGGIRAAMLLCLVGVGATAVILVAGNGASIRPFRSPAAP